MTQEQYIYSTHQEMVSDLTIAGRPLKDLVSEIQAIYLNDPRPWIIGFSGGKDSTTVLSLIYTALLDLSPDQRHKHVYVVSSDTMVETPVVVDMIGSVLERINGSAAKDSLPISAHAVSPANDRTFWVNLLGRGYPAPTTRFRWCTERMKIEPVSEFILEKVAEFGEVVVALGSRSQESASRAQVIAKHRIDGTALGRHASLPNAYTYMPIEDWHADEVWEYLMSAPCPWPGNNRELFELYKGSNQGECPLVIDKSTPSCGNSRFGCWTCTVVTEDKAIHGLIESGADWMQPLLNIRNYLWHTTQSENISKYRNHRRRTGKITFASTASITEDGNVERKHIHGPYWMKYRKRWLRRLLATEKQLREAGHDIELIKRSELQAIRQHWLWDPLEPDWADALPRIFRSVYPDEEIDWLDNDAGAFSEADARLLKELEAQYGAPAEMIMKLMEVELSMSGLSRRKGMIDKLTSILEQDWEALEDVKATRGQAEQRSVYRQKIDELQERYQELSA
jgi:DNA sulfur modification protein DndC